MWKRMNFIDTVKRKVQKMCEMFFGKQERNEKADFEELYKGISNEVFRARIKSAGNWYIERAIRLKKWFYIFEVISIILPLVISGLNSYGKANMMVTICALLTTLVTSILAFTKWREKWMLYRTTIEQMKRELTLYWVNGPNDEKTKELAKTIEAIMAQEHEMWIYYSKNRSEQADKTE